MQPGVAVYENPYAGETLLVYLAVAQAYIVWRIRAPRPNPVLRVHVGLSAIVTCVAMVLPLRLDSAEHVRACYRTSLEAGLVLAAGLVLEVVLSWRRSPPVPRCSARRVA